MVVKMVRRQKMRRSMMVMKRMSTTARMVTEITAKARRYAKEGHGDACKVSKVQRMKACCSDVVVNSKCLDSRGPKRFMIDT